MTTFPPGSTIGVLGSGQLGRMLAIEARRLGYRVHVFSPERDTPAGAIADREVVAEYEDLDAVAAFAKSVDVITFEFENVSAACAGAAGLHATVRPSGEILQISQHRLDEKKFLASVGVPVAPFKSITCVSDLQKATADWSGPSILKTARLGYDGKGQLSVKAAHELEVAWRRQGHVECVLESFVEFEKEVSVVIARGINGKTKDYGVIENHHVDHILDLSLAPAEVPEETVNDAREIAHAVAESLQLVGLLCIEMFVLGDGSVVVNEIAPRPHNSGHLTIEACVTNQFEQQLRAICGLPLGSPEFLRPAAMANLLGDLWTSAPPLWDRALATEDVKLHLYGKAHPKPGRKMGHLTATGATASEARLSVQRARNALQVAADPDLQRR